MKQKPKETSRYRQLLRAEKSLLEVVPLIKKAHEITRQHQRKVEITNK